MEILNSFSQGVRKAFEATRTPEERYKQLMDRIAAAKNPEEDATIQEEIKAQISKNFNPEK